MSKDDLGIIENKIEKLIKDKTYYEFSALKEKVEEILKSVDIFLLDNEVNQKAVDLYLKNVITKKNKIKKEQEKNKIIKDKEEKYTLIEAICKKHEFETQEELIEKIEELEKKTNLELSQINKF